ncbi:MAG: ATP-dependent DNA helicase Rep [Gammaproteobacteria bacterium]|nr:ATP-dependent DNA helicase Rep [Gammaproteobacteria bacterium]
MPTVAIASDFLDAFARVPRAQQKKVREFTEKFKTDPTSSAINYEKIHSVKDPKVRTVRIDQKYRAVVLHPDAGDVYVLVWVDNHDEAMAWAENRSFEINPVTGALQVVSVNQVQEAVQPKTGRGKRAGVLAQFDDELLLSFAVPSVLLPAVRAVQEKEELHALAKHLPAEAAEALIWLAEEMPPDEVRKAVSAQPGKEPVDTTDLAKALDHPDSRRRFVTVHTDDELNAMLDAPLEKWRIFLHPTQEQLVSKNFNGPAKIIGGAGTGKTVVAMHRARHLAKVSCSEPNDRILFTTYTANLAQNVEQNLANLCGDEREGIEIVHLHAWAVRFMKKQGVEFKIATNEELDKFWQDAVITAEDLEFDVGFLKQEWEQVVWANEIEDKADYLKVSRKGRGQTLIRPQRARVWAIFENYLNSLNAQGKHDWLSVIRQTRRFIERKKPALPYRAVIVDEAQDFHAEEWKLIRAISPPGPNGLFLVGDAHQRIYGVKVALRNCGINIQGRSTQLRINYRTTEQIRDWAMALLHGVEIDDLDDQKVSAQGYISRLFGSKPEVIRCPSLQEEQRAIGQRLKELIEQSQLEDICLVARTNKLLRENYQPILKDMGIAHTLLDKNQEGKGVRLATMHRVKGLEFPVMILAGVNAGSIPLKLSSAESDPVARGEHEDRERSLLFVAATRARDMLIVTCWGQPSPFLS